MFPKPENRVALGVQTFIHLGISLWSCLQVSIQRAVPRFRVVLRTSMPVTTIRKDTEVGFDKDVWPPRQRARPYSKRNSSLSQCLLKRNLNGRGRGDNVMPMDEDRLRPTVSSTGSCDPCKSAPAAAKNLQWKMCAHVKCMALLKLSRLAAATPSLFDLEETSTSARTSSAPLVRPLNHRYPNFVRLTTVTAEPCHSRALRLLASPCLAYTPKTLFTRAVHGAMWPTGGRIETAIHGARLPFGVGVTKLPVLHDLLAALRRAGFASALSWFRMWTSQGVTSREKVAVRLGASRAGVLFVPFLIIALALFLGSSDTYAQARTAERIVSTPHSLLNQGNPPDGSVRYDISGTPGSRPCAGNGPGAFAYKAAGVWTCPNLSPGVGTGDASGAAASSVGELVLFGDLSGKKLDRSNTLSGIPFLTSGVVSTLPSTGTGSVVRASSATLTTPALLTPTIGAFNNAQHAHDSAAGGGQLNASNVFSSGIIPPARIITGALTNSKCLRLSNVGQIEVSAEDCGTGSGGSAGGVSGNLTFNESGSFGGIANSSYDAVTGRLTFNQKANGNDTIYSQRFTDISPTGSFLKFRNADGSSDLFLVSASGAVTVSSTLTVKNTAAPPTPFAGNTILWTDVADKNLKAQDDGGNVSGTVRPITCAGTDKISSISSAGVVTCTADQGGTGTGVITLNTLNTSDQTFVAVDDANIDLSIGSSVSTHTFTVAWLGTLSKARQHAATAYTDAGNTFSTGAQSFAAATSLTIPTAAGASPTASAQIAYDSLSNTWEAGINGTNRIMAFTQGSQTFTDKTLDNSNTLNVRDTLLTLQDNTDSTKTVNFELSGITTGTNRVVTIANAPSVTVQPTTPTASQWITNIDSAGVQQKAQPTLADFTGTVPAVRGGTDQTAVTQGDLLFGSATNTWSRLAKSVTATHVLLNTGASNNPQWGQVPLATGVTGTLPDGNLSVNVSLLGSSIDLSGAEATGILAAARFPALTGDVTTNSGSLVTTITNDAVTNAKMANMATATFKGRATAGTGDPEDLTATQATALLNNATTSLKGLVPAPGSATGLFLRDDLTWAAPAGSGDMVLASPQTNTGLKTFNDGSLALNGGDYGASDGSLPGSPVEKSFYLNTNASSRRLFIYNNAAYREIFQSGLSGPISVPNGGTGLAAGTSGGVPYFSSTTTMASSGALTANLPVIGGGAGAAPSVGTRSGNTTAFVTTTGTLTSGRCAEWDASGNLIQASAACGSGGGGSGTVNTATVNQVAYYTSTTAVSGDAGMTYDATTDALTVASLVTNGSGAGSLELEEGTAPSAVANRVTITAPTDVTAGGWILSLPTTAGTSGQFLQTNGGGVTTWATPSGSGTVTATGGSLTSNSVVLGAGTTDTRVAAGIITDGTSKLTLGVAGTSVGSVDFKNATSGTVTLSPVTGALGTVTLSLPARTATVATTTGTLTSGRCVEIDGSGNLVQAAAACGSGGGSGTVTVVASGSLTSTALVTGGGTTTLQTPSATATLDSSGNMSLPGSLTLTGSGTGYLQLAPGTAPTVVASQYIYAAPATAPGGGLLYILPSDTPTNGEQLTANISGTTVTLSWDSAGAGSGITSLEGQTGATQTFTDDTNVTIVSGSNAHVITWVGTLAAGRGGTGSGAPAEDQVLVGNGTGYDLKTLPSCSNATTEKLLYNSSTNTFSCGADQTSGGGSGITTLNTLTGATQTFSKTDDTNVTLTITSTGTDHNFALGFTGTLADARVADVLTVTKISNLTSNGFVKTSSSDGTLSVDTNTYLTGNQTITLSGDVTGSGATSITTVVANLPSGVTAAGFLATTAIVAPSTPAAGIGRIYVDSTSKNLAVKDDAGVVKHGVQTQAAVTNNFLTAISDAGAVTVAQPAFSDLSGAATDAQIPDTITVDLATLATTATTANAGDSATAFFSTGALEVTIGGTGLTSGTSGGIPYFSGSTTMASSAALTANLPVIGGGAGAAPSVGTRSGSTTAFVTTTGTLTSGRCAEWDASGNLIQAAAACGSGGGGTITSGATNAIPKYTASTTLDDSLLSDDATTLTYSGTGGLSLTASGGGYIQFTEGTPPSIVANTVQHAVATDAPAAGVQYLWGSTAAASGVLRVANSSGVMTVTQDAGISHLASSTSADLAGVLSDEQGSGGGFVRATSPTLTTPALGVATATSINGLTITTSTGTLTIANSKTATVSNTLTFAGTDSTTMTFPGTSGTVATADSTKTFTNTSLDVEGTGNVLTMLSVADFPAAGCNNTTASSFWDLPTSTPAVATCVSGTNTQKAYLDFADTAGGFSAQTGFRLPPDFTGTIDAKITWLTTATSGNVKWSLSTICVATDATETDDPAFNTASTVTTAAAGVASRLQTSSITSLTITGCAASEFMHVKIFRQGDDAADTIAATARLVGVQLVLRRAQ